MDIVTLVAVALLQLVGLTLEQLRETVEAIKTALVQQYVDTTEGARLGAALSEELDRGESAASRAEMLRPQVETGDGAWEGLAWALERQEAVRCSSPTPGRTQLLADPSGAPATPQMIWSDRSGSSGSSRVHEKGRRDDSPALRFPAG